MKGVFVVVSEIEQHIQWLADGLGSDATLVPADSQDGDRVLQLVDTAAADAVFVRFGRVDFDVGARFVAQLIERKPELPVIVLGESDDRDVVLAALRAGARDFVSLEAPRRELEEVVDRQMRWSPAGRNVAPRGRMYSLVCARPDIATTTLALHTALAIRELAEPDEEVLLLDLGIPVGDSLLFLDLRPSYTLIDAVRSVRRFDESLIQAAFVRHSSGLAMLPMSEDLRELQQVSLTDMITIVGILKTFFDHVVVNLSGLFDIELIMPVLGKSDEMLVHVDQAVASCRSARRLLDSIQSHDTAVPAPHLVIDRYQGHLEPKASDIAELLSAPTWTPFPAAGFVFLEAMNSARTIFEIAPRSPYARQARGFAAELMGIEHDADDGPLTWLKRLLGRER